MARETDLPEYFRSGRADILRFLPSHFSRVLEVGCGGGAFSEKLLRDDVEIWGIEPDKSAADIARGKLTKVLNATFEAAAHELPARYFDLVICNDVIEHMPDHDQFLQAIKATMTDDAVLVGSLPNIRHITALVKLLALKDFPYRNEGILDNTHLRFFTRKSIERTLRQNGYLVEALRGVNSIIKEGICRGTTMQNLFWRTFTSAVVGLSFGYYSDVAYPQYAFRASLAPKSS